MKPLECNQKYQFHEWTWIDSQPTCTTDTIAIALVIVVVIVIALIIIIIIKYVAQLSME